MVSRFSIKRQSILIAPLEFGTVGGSERSAFLPCPAVEQSYILFQEYCLGLMKSFEVWVVRDHASPAGYDSFAMTAHRSPQRLMLHVPESVLPRVLEYLRYRSSRRQRNFAVKVDEPPAQIAREGTPNTRLATAHVADQGNGSLQQTKMIPSCEPEPVRPRMRPHERYMRRGRRECR